MTRADFHSVRLEGLDSIFNWQRTLVRKIPSVVTQRNVVNYHTLIPVHQHSMLSPPYYPVLCLYHQHNSDAKQNRLETNDHIFNPSLTSFPALPFYVGPSSASMDLSRHHLTSTCVSLAITPVTALTSQLPELQDYIHPISLFAWSIWGLVVLVTWLGLFRVTSEISIYLEKCWWECPTWNLMLQDLSKP